MTLVMDGVRGKQAPRGPLDLATSRPVRVASRVARRRPGGGLDGVRRQTIVEHQAVAAAPERGRWRPNFQWPSFSWRPRGGFRRPAMAVGMVSVALVASVVVARVLDNPRAATARADSSVVMPNPTKTPAPTPNTAAQTAQQQAALQQLLTTFVSTHSGGQFNIVVQNLATGAVASVDPDRSYMSASLYKLFVADQIYQEIDAGTLTYGAPAGGGSGNTVQGCLKLMITISDNTCGRALGAILNWGAQNPALASQGFTETDLTTPQQTSARDVAALFEKLYDGTLDSTASNAAFMALLKDQQVNDRLPQGLPAGTVIAHKTGNLGGVVHDGGIVYGPKSNYVVVVMSGPWALPGDAPAQFVTLSRELWSFFEQ